MKILIKCQRINHPMNGLSKKNCLSKKNEDKWHNSIEILKTENWGRISSTFSKLNKKHEFLIRNTFFSWGPLWG